MSSGRKTTKEEWNQLQSPEPSWVSSLRNQKGFIPSTHSNILTIFEQDAALRDAVAFNKFTQRPEVVAELPWRKGEIGEWTDRDDAGLRVYLGQKYGVKGRELVDDCLTIHMQNHSYHPLKDYLESLEWDGTLRLSTLLVDWLGAEDSKLTRTVTCLFLVNAVNRIYHPGAKWDYMLITTGPQGIGKSTIIDRLGVGYATADLSDLSNKDAMADLVGKWFVEMGELVQTKRADVETLKGFISRGVDDFRAPFGKRSQRYFRTCMFWGTSNESNFLKDITGNRRFWPIDCKGGKKHPGDMTQDEVDQIWAEAYHYWKTDFIPFEVIKDIESELVGAQESHRDIDELVGALEEWLDRPIPENHYTISDLRERAIRCRQYWGTGVRRQKVCASEVYREMDYEFGPVLSHAVSIRIKQALRQVPGWKEMDGATIPGYGRQRAFERIEENV